MSTEYTGKGNDRKGTRGDGLKLIWSWYGKGPGQCCMADVGKSGWTLHVTAWPCRFSREGELHLGYEPQLCFLGETISSAKPFYDLGDWKHYPTRLEAQRVAEMLLGRFLREAREALSNTQLPYNDLPSPLRKWLISAVDKSKNAQIGMAQVSAPFRPEAVDQFINLNPRALAESRGVELRVEELVEWEKDFKPNVWIGAKEARELGY